MTSRASSNINHMTTECASLLWNMVCKLSWTTDRT